MIKSKYHAKYLTLKLLSLKKGSETEKLIPIISSSNIEIFPHQIGASCFAFNNPYSKTTILADETGLGKSIEACLVMSKLYNDEKTHVILILPTHLVRQWENELEKFDILTIVVDNNKDFTNILNEQKRNPFDFEGIIITTYQFASLKHAFLSEIQWDLAVFEEGHRLRKLYTGENKTANNLHKAFHNTKKLILTATPIQTSILDLYGLIKFADDKVFTDEKTFYKRYFRKIENYPELGERASQICFRTLRSEAKKFIKFSKRIPVTVEFKLTKDEQLLYDMMEKYLDLPKKKAFPKMEQYYLTLLILKSFSSSTFALLETLKNMVRRLEDRKSEELILSQKMLNICQNIKTNAKGTALLQALNESFDKLKKVKANKKCVVFTENKQTQKYLFDLLNKKYIGQVLVFNGDNSRDYDIVDKFKNDYTILISTDIGAEGLNLEFCSLIVNYDIPFNILKLEQRIGRLHRQGQKNDVIIVNFLNKNNFADVRLLELINKRLIVFDGVFGSSDDLLGEFERDVSKIVANMRKKDEIDKSFNDLQKKYDTEIKNTTKTMSEMLFQTFDEKTLSKVKLETCLAYERATGKKSENISFENQIKSLCLDFEETLWELTKFRLKGAAVFNEDIKSITIEKSPFKNFRLAQINYFMDKKASKSQRYTLNNPLAKRLLEDLCFEQLYSGKIDFISDDRNLIGKHGLLALYKVNVMTSVYMESQLLFFGRFSNDETINGEFAEKIFNFPIKSVKTGFKNADKSTNYEEIIEYVDNEEKERLLDIFDTQKKMILDNFFSKMNGFNDMQINQESKHIEDLKSQLENGLHELKSEINRVIKVIPTTTDFKTKIGLQKQKSVLEKELRVTKMICLWRN